MGAGKGSEKRIKNKVILVNGKPVLNMQFEIGTKYLEVDNPFFYVEGDYVSKNDRNDIFDYYSNSNSPTPGIDLSTIADAGSVLYDKYYNDDVKKEIKNNPIFTYAVDRYVNETLKSISNNVYIEDYSTEKDYYGEFATGIIVSDYEDELKKFTNNLKNSYEDACAGRNDKIIEDLLNAEYGRLLPQLKNKAYKEKIINLNDIKKRRTNKSKDKLSEYEDTFKKYNKHNLDEYSIIAKNAPKLIVLAEPNGRYHIIDGHHRFQAYFNNKKGRGSIKIIIAS